MLNKEKSKEYEKHLMKKKAELLKYLRRQAVNLGKFTSMGEYLDKLKKEEKLCHEGDATRLYQSVYVALSRYFDRHRQGDDFYTIALVFTIRMMRLRIYLGRNLNATRLIL